MKMLKPDYFPQMDYSYTSEVDAIDKNSWNILLPKFRDASYYQTWSFGAIRWGEENLSHLVLKENGKIVSAVQLRIIRLPLLRAGVGYINWGPMWKRDDKESTVSNLRNMIRALRTEYVIKRGYFLRILPKVIDDEECDTVCRIFKEENYSRKPDPQQTVVVDLSPSLEELRRDLRKNTRHSLDLANKQNLEFIEGSDYNAYAAVLGIVKEMKLRKKYAAFSDPAEIIAVHKDLPESQKLKIILCTFEGEPVAAMGWHTIGSIGFPLVAATGDKAIRLKASFLLWWKMITYYKEHGFRGCDLAGVNPKKNPGGYFFKKSLAGRSYKEKEHYIGQFDACDSPISAAFFRIGISLMSIIRNLKAH